MKRSWLKARALELGIVGVAAVVVAACGSDDDGQVPTPDASSNGNGNGNGADADIPDSVASVRVVHAASDAPPVDIYVAGVAEPVITELAYGETSDYLEVDPGAYEFEVRAAGDDASTEPVYTTGAIELAEGARATAIAAGLLSGEGEEAFRVLALAEDFDEPSAGNAIVRIVHAGADAPTVAIDVGDNGTPDISDLERFADTGAAGVELPAGEPLQVAIWAGDPLERVTGFTTPELPEDFELFVIATGQLAALPREDTGFGLLAVGPAGSLGFIRQNPTVYALHASPDAPPVDIYAGESVLVENLAFGELSAPLQVPPGDYDLDFRAAGSASDSAPAATATTPELEAGERYLATATGFLVRAGADDESFQLLPAVDDLSLDVDAAAAIRVVHASPDAPPVDVGTVDAGDIDTVVVSDLAFPDISDEVEIPASPLVIGVAATGDTTPVATFDVELEAADRGFVVAAGALAPGQDEEGFRLIGVLTSEQPWVAVEIAPNQ